jgi:hypothetical protein
MHGWISGSISVGSPDGRGQLPDDGQVGPGRGHAVCGDQGPATRFAQRGVQARLHQHGEQQGDAFPDRRVIGADARLPGEGEQRLEAVRPVPFQAVVEIVENHWASACRQSPEARSGFASRPWPYGRV